MSEKELIYASPSDHISAAVKNMVDDDLSQLPVIEDNKVVVGSHRQNIASSIE